MPVRGSLSDQEESMEVNAKREELQGLLVLMSSLSHTMEKSLGRGAGTITFRAGRTIGLKADIASKTPDTTQALKVVGEELAKRGINWEFELWKPAADSSYFYTVDEKEAAKLVFRNCMVRCSLFRYSHEQKTSLCMMNHGLFCGFLQKITGKRADLNIIHAGENACIKELTLEPIGR
jgi:predicted hydrocarbon binding protein